MKFERSKKLKELIAEPLDHWKKSKGDLNILADKCGITPSYLSQLRRYGRIPGRSVLILLAFNLGIDGQELFDAAGINSIFPYDRQKTIRDRSEEPDTVFSVKLNSDHFAGMVKNIIREEFRKKSLKDLLRGRPLRIGVNYHQFWLFDSVKPPKDNRHGGFFPDLCNMLAVALQHEVELIAVPYCEYLDKLSKGEIDLYGPTLIVPSLLQKVNYTNPFFQVGMSAVMRKREHTSLKQMPLPETFKDLMNKDYKIAVLKDAQAHLLTNTKLKRPDDSLILCSTDEECMERVALSGINNPAHLYIATSMIALLIAEADPDSYQPLFVSKNNMLDMIDNVIAVRQDWPELIPLLNESIDFLKSRGGLSDQLHEIHNGHYHDVVNI